MKKMIFLFCLIAFACDTTPDEEHENYQQLDLDQFKMQMPQDWTYTPMHGVDAFVGIIEINAQEKISFDYGAYSNSLNVDPVTHEIIFKLVDGKGAKVVTPKVSGQGFTGLYIENVKGGSFPAKFTMSGLNLTTETEQSLLKVFRTVRFN